ncbi:hypothetical protein PAHAL_2G136000 [Panicum hallii]|uniref:Uncharacterized protein n=1 Tax=Panicum hallii TaxID=206008 RepID=A0A2T8KNZ0_9POAL|nr:hypothetical protein PAHAL_2G136000 [Panicum hallii]
MEKRGNQALTYVLLNVHDIKIMSQLQIFPILQVPQTNPPAPNSHMSTATTVHFRTLPSITSWLPDPRSNMAYLL